MLVKKDDQRQLEEKHNSLLADLEAEKGIYSNIPLSSLPSPPPTEVNHCSHAHSCTVALACWVIKGDDDDYRPYYASLETFQFNTEGPNGATVYLKYFTLIKGIII